MSVAHFSKGGAADRDSLPLHAMVGRWFPRRSVVFASLVLLAAAAGAALSVGGGAVTLPGAAAERSLSRSDPSARSSLAGSDAHRLAIPHSTKQSPYSPGELGNSISGIVINADGRPVPHVEVAAAATSQAARPSDWHESMSGPDGRFVFTSLPRGRYLVGVAQSAAEAGWIGPIMTDRWPDATIPASAGKLAPRVELGPSTPTVEVTVVVRGVASVQGQVFAGGVPVANAFVRLGLQNYNGENHDAHTDDRGRFAFTRVLPADYTLQTWLKGSDAPTGFVPPPPQILTVAERAAVVVDVVSLPAVGEAVGRVLDEAGLPLVGLNVHCIHAPPADLSARVAAAVTGTDGTFRLTGLPLVQLRVVYGVGDGQLPLGQRLLAERTVPVDLDMRGASGLVQLPEARFPRSSPYTLRIALRPGRKPDPGSGISSLRAIVAHGSLTSADMARALSADPAYAAEVRARHLRIRSLSADAGELEWSVDRNVQSATILIYSAKVWRLQHVTPKAGVTEDLQIMF